MLRARPILKAAATSSTLMAVGDYTRQCLQQHDQQQARHKDWASVARFACIGAALHGPFFSTGMAVLDRQLGADQSLRTAIKKAAVGQLTLFPTYTCAFFLLMGALEGRDLSASITKLTTAFPQTAATGTLFWPAANLITFSLAPQHRIAFLGLANIAWSSFLSMVNSSEPGLTSP